MHLEMTPPAGELAGIDPDDLHHEYELRRLGRLSDEQLFDIAARVISRPKHDPANSFVLHAPLELLARRALLRLVPPDRRDAVRERITWVAATYERAGAGLEPAPGATFASPGEAASALPDAIRDRDLDTVDAATSWLARHGSTHDVMALAQSSVDSLAAAGHGSIYFFHLARTAAGSRAALALLRPLAREIARFPELRIEWIREGVEAHGTDASRFAHALARRAAPRPPRQRLHLPDRSPGRRRGAGPHPDSGRAAAGPDGGRGCHPARRRPLDAAGRSHLRALRVVALHDVAAVRARHHTLAPANRRGHRDRRDLRGRVPRRGRARTTSTSIGSRNTPP